MVMQLFQTVSTSYDCDCSFLNVYLVHAQFSTLNYTQFVWHFEEMSPFNKTIDA